GLFLGLNLRSVAPPPGVEHRDRAIEAEGQIAEAGPERPSFPVANELFQCNIIRELAERRTRSPEFARPMCRAFLRLTRLPPSATMAAGFGCRHAIACRSHSTKARHCFGHGNNRRPEV